MAQPRQPPARSMFGSLVLIAVVIGGGAAAFAYTAGWFSPQRLTPDKLVDALTPPTGEPLGHRRNHAKGICGDDEPAMTLSTAFPHLCGETSRSIRGTFTPVFAHIPVSLTKPGHTVPIVTPVPSSSRSTDRLRAVRPALVAE